MEEHNYVNSPASPQSPYSTSSRSPKPSNNVGSAARNRSRHCKTPNFSQDEDSKDSSKMKDYFDQDLIKPVSVKLENCLLLKPETNKVLSQKKQAYVHLTPYEITGLKTIVQWLDDLPKAKRCVPKDIMDPVALLEDAKVRYLLIAGE